MYQQSPIISGGVIPIEKRVLPIWTKQGIKRRGALYRQSRDRNSGQR